MNTKRLIFLIIGIVVVILLFSVMYATWIYREWGLICEHCLSHKGHKQWRGGVKTGKWYEKSALEEYIELHKPEAISHKWVSYAGTGKNIFGRSILYGHGRPGPQMQLRSEFLEEWIKNNNQQTIFAFIELLKRGTREDIEKRVNEIFEEVFSYHE